jgi:uncharacterized membrane protein YedE/YeeE
MSISLGYANALQMVIGGLLFGFGLFMGQSLWWTVRDAIKWLIAKIR